MMTSSKRKSPPSSSSTTSKDVNPIMFFKVYLPDRSSQHLTLPSAFVKRLNGTLPPSSILVCSGNRTWSVDVKKVDNTLSFENGWTDFVKDNSLEPGDFLVFSYLGTSRFNVKIYGKSGCEKSYLHDVNEIKIETEDDKATQHHQYEQTNGHGEDTNNLTDEEELSSGDSEISWENQKQTCRKKKDIRVKKHPRVSTKQNGKDSNVTAEKDIAPDSSRKCESEYPQFKIGVLPVYISHGSLNIPMPFAEKYLKVGRTEIALRVLSKSWPVTLTTYANGCCKISSGWLAFVRDNYIQEGDICLFELIDTSDYTFRVSIFPCSS